MIAAAAVAAVVLLLLAWGSGSGSTILSQPSATAGIATGDPPSISIAVGDQELVTQSPEISREITTSLDWLMIFFALVVLAIAIKFVQWLLRRNWEPGEEPQDEDDEDDLGLLLVATSEEARISALAEGEPRNVVVRCWVLLEDAATASGLERNPAETAAEFTRRLLSGWEVEESATRELAELYREARFSRHPVTAEAGERAVALVEQIHAQLTATKERRARAEAEAAAGHTTAGQPTGFTDHAKSTPKDAP